MNLPEIDYSQLDDGIRDTVRWLRSLGFDTTDSGDGKKRDMECFIDQPNVFMLIGGPQALDPAHWMAETYRLLHAVSMRGIEVDPGMVTLSWDPVQGTAILCLLGVDDVELACNPPGCPGE